MLNTPEVPQRVFCPQPGSHLCPEATLFHLRFLCYLVKPGKRKRFSLQTQQVRALLHFPFGLLKN